MSEPTTRTQRLHARYEESTIAALKAENERLREALGTFADECDENISDSESDSDQYKSRFGKLTVGDFRAARAALTKQEG